MDSYLKMGSKVFTKKLAMVHGKIIEGMINHPQNKVNHC